MQNHEITPIEIAQRYCEAHLLGTVWWLEQVMGFASALTPRASTYDSGDYAGTNVIPMRRPRTDRHRL